MSTRSAIGIKHGDRIKAVYCHYDGYLEHVGRALHTHYQDSIKVNKLISMGDMSGIGADIGEKHAFSERSEYLPDGIATQCTFYDRDREEEDVGYRSFAREAEFIDYYDGCGVEFYYLYDHGVWYYSTGRDFTPLHESTKVRELA
ncbi:hypothetical protein UFOVP112_363 [uncultured Caudovirales phage]|uniref:Uncharacterized protein n=1 Tax=uncultured Caudovirales phage TaxID=2100421 RepID=A0A6J5L5P6_9CAUD|nr:hypothetical protein UFOVP112_363 [uncultured Caudovirales phage]